MQLILLHFIDYGFSISKLEIVTGPVQLYGLVYQHHHCISTDKFWWQWPKILDRNEREMFSWNEISNKNIRINNTCINSKMCDKLLFFVHFCYGRMDLGDIMNEWCEYRLAVEHENHITIWFIDNNDNNSVSINQRDICAV